MTTTSSCVQLPSEKKDATSTLRKLLSQDNPEAAWQEPAVKMSLEEMARRLQRVQSWSGAFAKVDFSDAIKVKLAEDETVERINRKHWGLAETVAVS